MFATNEESLDFWDDVGRFSTEMNYLFGQYGLEPEDWPALAYRLPAVKVWEDRKNVYVEAELPGVELEQVVVEVTVGNHLLLQGERTAPKAEEGSWWCQERPFGKFARVLSLPCEVNADRFDTRLENGILHITLPKSASSRAELVWAESD